MFYEVKNTTMREKYEWSDQFCELCWGSNEKVLHIRRQHREALKKSKKSDIVTKGRVGWTQKPYFL